MGFTTTNLGGDGDGDNSGGNGTGSSDGNSGGGGDTCSSACPIEESVVGGNRGNDDGGSASDVSGGGNASDTDIATDAVAVAFAPEVVEVNGTVVDDDEDEVCTVVNANEGEDEPSCSASSIAGVGKDA